MGSRKLLLPRPAGSGLPGNRLVLTVKHARMGEVEGASGQSGIVHVMLVAVCESTRHTLPLQTSTVGGPLPPANPVPVSVSDVFVAACAVDAAVSVGVAPESKKKLHGRSDPDVESETGSL